MKEWNKLIMIINVNYEMHSTLLLSLKKIISRKSLRVLFMNRCFSQQDEWSVKEEIKLL